jgi:hypothetical protein
MNSEKDCCSSHGLTKMRSPFSFVVGESAFLFTLAYLLGMYQRCKLQEAKGYRYPCGVTAT